MSETKITLDVNPNRPLTKLVGELVSEWGRARNVSVADVSAMLIGTGRAFSIKKARETGFINLPLSEAQVAAAWDYAEAAAVDIDDAIARELGRSFSRVAARDDATEQAKETARRIEREAFEKMQADVKEFRARLDAVLAGGVGSLKARVEKLENNAEFQRGLIRGHSERLARLEEADKVYVRSAADIAARAKAELEEKGEKP